jgi:hypothetical protein
VIDPYGLGEGRPERAGNAKDIEGEGRADQPRVTRGRDEAKAQTVVVGGALAEDEDGEHVEDLRLVLWVHKLGKGASGMP